MPFPSYVRDAIRDAITVPPHIAAAANACRYDLLHGPSYSLIPAAGIEAFNNDSFATFASDLDATAGTVTETYSGPVGDALREFLANVPTLYVTDDGYASECEPAMEPFPDADDVDAEWFEPEPYYQVDSSDVAGLLFGETIGREFR